MRSLALQRSFHRHCHDPPMRLVPAAPSIAPRSNRVVHQRGGECPGLRHLPLSKAGKPEPAKGARRALTRGLSQAIGIVAANMPIVGPWLARGVRRVPSLRSRQASAYGADGTKASPAGTHELSVLDKGAKEKSGRKGLGWTTMDGESNECMVEEADHQMHAGLSRERSRDTNASSSSARAVEGPPAQDIGISQAIY